jgi:hypothetical protein
MPTDRNEIERLMKQKVRVGHKLLRKIIPYPGPVNDGTVRCIACGQIDEEDWHDPYLCREIRALKAKEQNDG